MVSSLLEDSKTSHILISNTFWLAWCPGTIESILATSKAKILLSPLQCAQSIIFAKALAELTKSSAAEGSASAFASPLFYGILFVLVLSIGNQLHWCVLRV